MEAFGASGAAAGLMGYGLGLVLERLWKHFVARQQRLEIVDGRLESRGRGRNDRGQPATSGDLAVLTGLVNVAQCGNFLMREWRSARGDESWTGIDHVGHLTGFAAGVAVLIVGRLQREWN
eukprot:gnl/TRDRNA2_/TRDRNA2_94333_c0_seq2.p1 gnl/TRDRNA2_/TRDRNA2_94333_c0~~gnl/TRDRNA2_/TRDRNA2_94333_c0_seq2.p1  ORF type:complete len:121 (+),score=10.88 gnl/TRDRNA2_/TRDRNA2_94333_c0_seq2:131-493(+)